MTEPRPTTRKGMVAYLKAYGVHANDHGPVEREPVAVLGGMVERVRSREAARAAGAGPCSKHAGEVEGACPVCRGLWTAAPCPEHKRWRASCPGCNA